MLLVAAVVFLGGGALLMLALRSGHGLPKLEEELHAAKKRQAAAVPVCWLCPQAPETVRARLCAGPKRALPGLVESSASQKNFLPPDSAGICGAQKPVLPLGSAEVCAEQEALPLQKTQSAGWHVWREGRHLALRIGAGAVYLLELFPDGGGTCVQAAAAPGTAWPPADRAALDAVLCVCGGVPCMGYGLAQPPARPEDGSGF